MNSLCTRLGNSGRRAWRLAARAGCCDLPMPAGPADMMWLLRRSKLHALAQQEFQNKEVRGFVARSEHPSSLSLGIWPVTRGATRRASEGRGMCRAVWRGKVSSSKFLPTDESRDTVELELKLGCHRTGKTKWSHHFPYNFKLGNLDVIAHTGARRLETKTQLEEKGLATMS